MEGGRERVWMMEDGMGDWDGGMGDGGGWMMEDGRERVWRMGD